MLRQLDGHIPISLAELSRRTTIPKSTVRRLLLVMCAQGLARPADPGYVLGHLAADLGSKVAGRLPDSQVQLIVPHLLALHSATDGIVCLGVLQADEVICLRTLHRETDLALVRRLARPALACGTALGRALLADRSDELHTDDRGGVVTLAMGISDRRGGRIAAISVAGPTGRFGVGNAAARLRTAVHGASRAIRLNLSG
ncbi:hypothetical protein GCM10022267_84980 [Lentzea roselyniae]|uniref:IclR-ED domain-containing protein n=1 Tax=Lentzea roselyniae TaxID=531940 RepID=A0ABP7CAA3_9PSEU